MTNSCPGNSKRRPVVFIGGIHDRQRGPTVIKTSTNSSLPEASACDGTHHGRKRLASVLAACFLVLSAPIAAPYTAEAVTVSATVEARLVCSTSSGRCYVQNPAPGVYSGVPQGARCVHVYNVGWAINSPWQTYSYYRQTRCGSWR